MPFRVVDLFKVGIVGDCFDPFLQRNHLIVTGHHDDGPELQALGKVHGTERDVPACRSYPLVEHLEGKPGFLHRRAASRQFGRRPYEQSDLVRLHAFSHSIGEPAADSLDLIFGGVQDREDWLGSVEDGDRATPLFEVAVDVGAFRPEQSVGLRPDLVGGSVVDPQCPGTLLDVDPQRLPREGLLEDPLPQVTREEQTVRAIGADNSAAKSFAVILTGLGTGYTRGIDPRFAYVNRFPVWSCNTKNRPSFALRPILTT